MNGAGQAIRGAGRRLGSTPAAVFVAVLTVGLGAASTARHLGLYGAGFAAARRCSVVLACPRTNAARAAVARAHASTTSPANAAQDSRAAVANSSADSPAAGATSAGTDGSVQNVQPEKSTVKKGGGGGGLTVPLLDFSAPELSRFISPL